MHMTLKKQREYQGGLPGLLTFHTTHHYPISELYQPSSCKHPESIECNTEKQQRIDTLWGHREMRSKDETGNGTAALLANAKGL